MSAVLSESPKAEKSIHYDLPFLERLAVRQARVVLFYAFIIGLLISLAQIANDYFGQRKELKGTLTQLTESIQKPAENAIWDVNEGLAEGVIEGLLGYEPILDVKLFDADSVMLENSKPRLPKEPTDWLISQLFGDSYTLKVPLFSPLGDRTDQIGHVEILVDPTYAGRAFLNRSLVVVGSGVARTLLLSCALLVLFYFTLTRPVLAVAHYVKAADPKSKSPQALSIDSKYLHGELNILFQETQRFMTTIHELNSEMEGHIKQRTQELD